MTTATIVQKTIFCFEIFFLASALIVYMCGNSVLWMLLSIERDDIEHFYSNDNTNGISYVLSLLDETKNSQPSSLPSAAHSFSWLLKSQSAVQRFCSFPHIESKEIDFNKLVHTSRYNASDGFSSPVFHPPSAFLV